MSEIIQIQKLNGWWEEINFHFMKYFPIWNNITYGMSSFSAVHNTLPLTEGNETAVTCGYCDIYTESDLWRYLCDCDPLGTFSRQRWLWSLMREECHQPVKLNIPTPDRRIYSVGLSQMMMAAISISQLPDCCCSSVSDPCCSYPGALQTAADYRDYQGQHCKWANTG